MINANSTPLPRAPKGWFVYRYYLLSDGGLAVVWTDRDINAEYRAWMASGDKLHLSQKRPDFWEGKAQVVFITEFDASDPISIPLVRYPMINRFPDGRWLVTSARAGDNESNAHILAEDGQPIGSFALGDGIDHVRCAQDGTIWIGYFDEGCSGNSVGSGGIVQFDANGQPLWSYNDSEGAGQSFIDECYALTLAGDEIWACFYSEFPILRVKGGQKTLWTNKVSGAKALAVDGAVVLLAGGYDEDANRLALVRLEQGDAKLIGQFQCPEIENADLISGHSSMIHVVKNECWTRISVSDAQSALS
jgi:hypothetical protein